MPKFLFVNKDAASTSLTRSSPVERSSINSHVQRGRRHKRAATTTHSSLRRHSSRASEQEIVEASIASSDLESPTSPNSSVIPIRHSNSNEFVLVFDDQISPVSTKSHASTTSDQDDESPTPTTVSAITPDTENAVLPRHSTIISSSSSPRDISQLSTNLIDPFDETCIKIGAQEFKLLQYYQNVYHPAVWHAETLTSAKGGYTFKSQVQDVLRHAMQNEVEMYAMLACMASRIENVDRVAGQGTDKYLQGALRATRQLLTRISDSQVKTNEQLLLIIFHLYAAEGYRDNLKAAKIHLRAAKTIVHQMGGLDKVQDAQIREFLIIGDAMFSALTLRPWEFECDFDPGPYTTATPSELRLPTPYDLGLTAPALRQPAGRNLLPENLQMIIEEIAECSWVLDNAKTAPFECRKHALRWLHVRNMAIRHRLQNLSFQDPLINSLQVAILLWIVTTMTLLGLKKLSIFMAPQLKDVMQRLPPGSKGSQGSLAIRVWILTIGAMFAKVDSVDERWFIQNLVDLGFGKMVNKQVDIETMQAEVFDHLLNFESRFFYHDTVQRPRLQRLAVKITERIDIVRSSEIRYQFAVG